MRNNIIFCCLAFFTLLFFWACEKDILSENQSNITVRMPGNGNGNGPGGGGGPGGGEPPQCNEISFCVDASGDINGKATAVNCEDHTQDDIIVATSAGGPTNFCMTFGYFTGCDIVPTCFDSVTFDNKGLKISNVGTDGQNILVSVSKYFVSADGKKYAYLGEGTADLWPSSSGDVMTVTINTYGIVKDGKHTKSCLIPVGTPVCEPTSIVVERDSTCTKDCES